MSPYAAIVRLLIAASPAPPGRYTRPTGSPPPPRMPEMHDHPPVALACPRYCQSLVALPASHPSRASDLCPRSGPSPSSDHGPAGTLPAVTEGWPMALPTSALMGSCEHWFLIVDFGLTHRTHSYNGAVTSILPVLLSACRRRRHVLTLRPRRADAL
ncbi:hypothetical protein AURDEDRAFT_178658 [Auricularia subglabra TFB-10046 SS5]|uniref:Uncharacterized protein n=1 Tax=Auricularia subglabra (strain TFB-10046 / SS5) TaxID=717982 RepID=J0D146_AURST|nr:hypothetical protein AURDEDRAFT_178658 [Auricularia subglabra TFB-10046 SS5]